MLFNPLHFSTKENIMKQALAIVAFAVAIPMSSPAHAYIKCDKIEDAKKKKKCVSKMDKKLEKMRANQTPISAADVGKEFAYLDSQKLFESDDWYLGYKKTGFEDIDAVNKQLTAAKGLIRLTRYAGHLNKTDKAAAKKLGGKLMPRLKEIQTELDAVSAKLEQVNTEQYVGMDAVKVAAALAATTAQVAATVGEVPGALAAIGPVVAGGVEAMVGDAVNQATGAINDAASTINEAKEMAEEAKKAIE